MHEKRTARIRTNSKQNCERVITIHVSFPKTEKILNFHSLIETVYYIYIHNMYNNPVYIWYTSIPISYT